MTNNELGSDPFVWWTGIVESRQDPAKVGRCLVRIFGKHTDNKSDLPTSNLRWAHPILPLNNANPYTPKEGDMVVGFFMDSKASQYPVMLGIVPGIATMAAQPDKGFFDPRKGDELTDAPVKPDESPTNYPRVLGEPTTSRLARNESLDKTIVRKKAESLAQEGEWTEPLTAYATKYPYNRVEESESGHVIEIDDTPGAERLHRYHRAGTFEEIHPDGTRITKVVKDDYSITIKDKYVLVEGDCFITVNGNAKLKVHGDVTETVDGNRSTTVNGNITEVVSGNKTITISGSLSETVTGSVTEIVDRNKITKVRGPWIISANNLVAK